MEVPGGKKGFNFAYAFAFEMIGTAFLLIAINWSNGDIFTVCLTLFSMIVLGGPVSGGHFNPAVTLAVYFRQSYEDGDYLVNILYTVAMIIAQFVGAFIGVAIGAMGHRYPLHEEKLTQIEKAGYMLAQVPILCPNNFFMMKQ